ncbi:MAG TPA: M23 family metallopeptidase, partial [Candidatus Saccharimonadales bacterium]|nr:M23 family metallopeptidase [Candidatus Saccharimonadales bacterium]
NDVEAIANSYSQVVQPPETPEGPSAYSLPVNRAQVSLATLSEPHWDNTPAADLPLPTGTPVYAVTAGQVIAVTASGNCGNGVVMLGSDGYKYTYCHASVTKVSTGQPVASGQQIMLSGNSGHSFGPHLHFQISTAVGVKICPQPLLVAWYEGKDVRPSPQPTAARCGYP